MKQNSTFEKDRRLLKLRYWREVVGVKQENFATLLGCKKSNYCMKETGKSEIKLSEMLKLQKALNQALKKQGKLPLDENGKPKELILDDIFV